MDYALARLEAAIEEPSMPAPPIVDRVGPSVKLDAEFAAIWPAARAQVADAASYVGRVKERGADRRPVWVRLARAVRMMTHFAQNIETLGVPDKHKTAGEGPA